MLWNVEGGQVMDSENILDMRHINKSFAGIQALKDVSLVARRGKVNILMGENGAGKSTIMKILAGAERKDSGDILIDGKKVEIASPQDAMNEKVVMIYQELNLVEEMTVADNLFMGIEPVIAGFVDDKYIIGKTKKLIEEYELKISPADKVSELNMGKRQMLEIIKAIEKNAKIVIMDEPTSSLTIPEVQSLFKIIGILLKKGVTIIYISHRMQEVFEIGDYITVMRDGMLVCELEAGKTNQEELISYMVGRSITQMFPKRAVDIGEKKLEVKNLTKKGMFQDISFYLRKGEILGFSGLVGSGRTEIAMNIFGAIKPDSGEIYLNNEKISLNNVSRAMERRIAYVPEDRKHFGLDLKNRIRDNISICTLDDITKFGFVKQVKEIHQCKKMVDRLEIKTTNIMNSAGSLSGGNQQKVVLAKWLLRDLEVLILDEPTRGVDVGAKEEIHKIIVELAMEGVSIILISSELPEVLGMSDRIIVLHEGKITAELDAKEANQEMIMTYATGMKNP